MDPPAIPCELYTERETAEIDDLAEKVFYFSRSEAQKRIATGPKYEIVFNFTIPFDKTFLLEIPRLQFLSGQTPLSFRHSLSYVAQFHRFLCGRISRAHKKCKKNNLRLVRHYAALGKRPEHDVKNRALQPP